MIPEADIEVLTIVHGFEPRSHSLLCVYSGVGSGYRGQDFDMLSVRMIRLVRLRGLCGERHPRESQFPICMANLCPT